MTYREYGGGDKEGGGVGGGGGGWPETRGKLDIGLTITVHIYRRGSPHTVRTPPPSSHPKKNAQEEEEG
jgi:hypothetical protein